MADKTKIEWTDATWNPVRGCVKVSPGCKNCYAETFAERWRGIAGHPYEQGFDPRIVPEKLGEPLRWQKGRRVFVNSMSDLFQEAVPDDYIARVFSVMSRAKQHVFQVLTKRSARMRGWTSCVAYGLRVWPLPNVHLGVSVENPDQKKRIEHLRRTPAAVRFLSLEPLLEDLGTLDLTGIHWVIVGGESGPGARPCNLKWIRDIVRQCRAAGVACFVKQLGSKPEEVVTAPSDGHQWNRRVVLKDRKGGNPAEWPEDLRVRQ